MPDEGSASDVQYAMDQLAANAPPPSAPSDASPDPITPASNGKPDANGWTGEVWETYDGSKPLREHNAWTAARELAHSRRQRDLEGDGSTPKPITEVRYQDGRPLDQEVSAAEAAKDLSAYRQQTAQRLLADLGVEQPAPQPEAAPTPQPEQSTFSPEQLEAASQRQQAEQYTQAAWRASGDYQNLLQAGIENLLGQAGEFNDVKALANQVGEQAALRQLAEQDPARFARFQELDGKFRQVQNELANIRTQQAEAYTASFQQFAEEQDKLAEAAIPELRATADPRARAAIQQGALDILLEAGMSKRDIEYAWSRGGMFQLRSAAAQRVLADAAKWRLSNAKAREALKAPHPEVQRPGVRMPESSYSDQQIESQRKALNSSGSLRDAVALRRAQYAQRRNGG
jgi:hypothetical protein